MSAVLELDEQLECTCEHESENLTIAGLTHRFLQINQFEDISALMELLNKISYRQVVIFLKSPSRCQHLSHILNEEGYKSTFVHESMDSFIRTIRFRAFRNFNPVSDVDFPNILVASGYGHAMDIKGVDIAINFDASENPTEYFHRASSKLLKKGLVISLIRENKNVNLKTLSRIEKRYKIHIKPLTGDLPDLDI